MEELEDAMKEQHSAWRLNVETLASQSKILDSWNANLNARKMKLEEKSIFLEGVLKIHWVRRGKLFVVDGFRTSNIFVDAVECRHDSQRTIKTLRPSAILVERNIHDVEGPVFHQFIHFDASLVVRHRDERLGERSAQHEQRKRSKTDIVAPGIR